MSEGRSKKVYEFSFSLQTKQKLLGSIFTAEGAKADEARHEGDDLMAG